MGLLDLDVDDARGREDVLELPAGQRAGDAAGELLHVPLGRGGL
ncbi:MAG: hypothetical protein AB7G37_07950 [Solirubrobacteraceae bacterium]